MIVIAPKLNLDTRKVPDWSRRGLRIAICIAFFGLIGQAPKWPSSLSTYASEFKTSCNWASITCIVVTAPLIGKVSQVSLERTVGTIIGGMTGFLAYDLGNALFGAYGAGIFISLASTPLAIIAYFLAAKFSQDQICKFVMLTYIIVAFSSSPSKSAFVLACLRISGIIAGVVMSLLLAVFVLPRSATVEVVMDLRKVLRSLIQLNKLVWEHNHTNAEERRGLGSSSSPIGVPSPSRKGYSSLQGHGLQGEAAARMDACETLVASIYSTLAKVDENMELVRGEVYLWHFWGHYMFVPGISWIYLGKWHIPREDVRQLAVCLRRMTRLLWALLLDFQEGFDESMQAVLQQYYPKALMSELTHYMALTLTDLANTFPSGGDIPIDNLMNLGQIVDCLIQISNTRSQQAVFSLKRDKERQRERELARTYRDLSSLETALSSRYRNINRSIELGRSRMSAAGESSRPDDDVEKGTVPEIEEGRFLSTVLSSIPGETVRLPAPPRLLRRLSGIDLIAPAGSGNVEAQAVDFRPIAEAPAGAPLSGGSVAQVPACDLSSKDLHAPEAAILEVEHHGTQNDGRSLLDSLFSNAVMNSKEVENPHPRKSGEAGDSRSAVNSNLANSSDLLGDDVSGPSEYGIAPLEKGKSSKHRRKDTATFLGFQIPTLDGAAVENGEVTEVPILFGMPMPGAETGLSNVAGAVDAADDGIFLPESSASKDANSFFTAAAASGQRHNFEHKASITATGNDNLRVLDASQTAADSFFTPSDQLHNGQNLTTITNVTLLAPSTTERKGNFIASPAASSQLHSTPHLTGFTNSGNGTQSMPRMGKGIDSFSLASLALPEELTVVDSLRGNGNSNSPKLLAGLGSPLLIMTSSPTLHTQPAPTPSSVANAFGSSDDILLDHKPTSSSSDLMQLDLGGQIASAPKKDLAAGRMSSVSTRPFETESRQEQWGFQDLIVGTEALQQPDHSIPSLQVDHSASALQPDHGISALQFDRSAYALQPDRNDLVLPSSYYQGSEPTQINGSHTSNDAWPQIHRTDQQQKNPLAKSEKWLLLNNESAAAHKSTPSKRRELSPLSDSYTLDGVQPHIRTAGQEPDDHIAESESLPLLTQNASTFAQRSGPFLGSDLGLPKSNRTLDGAQLLTHATDELRDGSLGRNESSPLLRDASTFVPEPAPHLDSKSDLLSDKPTVNSIWSQLHGADDKEQLAKAHITRENVQEEAGANRASGSLSKPSANPPLTKASRSFSSNTLSSAFYKQSVSLMSAKQKHRASAQDQLSPSDEAKSQDLSSLSVSTWKVKPVDREVIPLLSPNTPGSSAPENGWGAPEPAPSEKTQSSGVSKMTNGTREAAGLGAQLRMRPGPMDQDAVHDLANAKYGQGSTAALGNTISNDSVPAIQPMTQVPAAAVAENGTGSSISSSADLINTNPPAIQHTVFEPAAFPDAGGIGSSASPGTDLNDIKLPAIRTTPEPAATGPGSQLESAPSSTNPSRRPSASGWALLSQFPGFDSPLVGITPRPSEPGQSGVPSTDGGWPRTLRSTTSRSIQPGLLSTMVSNLAVEPVTFPPTEEGYMLQMRWFSFQFVMDEIVEEMEEAFLAVSALLHALPYPIT